jgi:hypothetical protein
VKRTCILAVLGSTALFSLLGCGTPARGNLQTVGITSSSSKLAGEGGTLQLVVMANFGKESDNVTNQVTYAVTPTGFSLDGQNLPNPPQTVTISSTGMLTAVPPFVCTYHNVGTATAAAYVLTGSYQVLATFRGVTSQPFFVGVGSASGDGPSSACG